MVRMVLVRPPMIRLRDDSLRDDFEREQATAPFVAAPAFTGFAAGNLQVLRQFFPEAAPEPFLHVRADGIETADLLFGQFASPEIPRESLRIIPKIVEQLPGKLVDAESFQRVVGFWR